VNNFEKIKAMDIDEMARWLTQFVNLDCYDCNENPNCDSCYKENKLWVESEVREYWEHFLVYFY
jgi:hypothetical protein